MSREWKPGDVAMVKIFQQEHVALRQYGGWINAHCERATDLGPVDSAHPLVLIDPRGNPEGLPYLVPQHFRNYAATLRKHHGPISAQMLEFLADQLEAFVPEPPPKEPTDPKARVTDRRENVWRLLADGEWVCTSGPDIGEYLEWSRLAAERGPLEVSAS